MQLTKSVGKCRYNMKKKWTIFILVCFCFALFLLSACQKTTSSKDKQAFVKENQMNQPIKIGIIQLVEHPALDEARKGFIQHLAELGYKDKENISIDIENAQGDQSNCQTIADQFKNNNYDLILAIATPASQAVANVIKNVPILVTAVTDPQSSGLVASNEMPDTNLSGTSDRSPIKKQIELLKQLDPNVKKLTILYTSSEVNAELQATNAKDIAQTLGYMVNVKTISSSNEIQQVVESVISHTDALYIPTDNLLASSMGLITNIANAAKVPVIGAEENHLKNGALATIGINYFDLGKQTADMAVEIFKGKSIKKMPIEYAKDTILAINLNTAKQIGLTIPNAILKTAKIIDSTKD